MKWVQIDTEVIMVLDYIGELQGMSSITNTKSKKGMGIQSSPRQEL
jgi:hypothetical protein